MTAFQFVEEIERTDDLLVARIVQRPTVATAERAAGHIISLESNRDIVLDCTLLENAVSLVIAALIRLSRAVPSLTLRHVPPDLRQKLTTLRVDDFFRFQNGADPVV